MEPVIGRKVYGIEKIVGIRRSSTDALLYLYLLVYPRSVYYPRRNGSAPGKIVPCSCDIDPKRKRRDYFHQAHRWGLGSLFTTAMAEKRQAVLNRISHQSW